MNSSDDYVLTSIEVNKTHDHPDSYFRKDIHYNAKTSQCRYLELYLSNTQNGFYLTWEKDTNVFTGEYFSFSHFMAKTSEKYVEIEYDDTGSDRPEYLEFANTITEYNESDLLEYDRVFRLSAEAISYYKSLKEVYIDSVKTMKIPDLPAKSQGQFISSYTSQKIVEDPDHYCYLTTDSLIVDGILRIKFRRICYKIERDTLPTGFIRTFTSIIRDSANVIFSSSLSINITNPDAKNPWDTLLNSTYYHFGSSTKDTLEIQTFERTNRDDGHYEMNYIHVYKNGSPYSKFKPGAKRFFSKSIVVQHDKKGSPFKAQAYIDFVEYSDKNFSIIKDEKNIWRRADHKSHEHLSYDILKVFYPYLLDQNKYRKYRKRRRRKSKPMPLKSYFKYYEMMDSKRIEKNKSREVWEGTNYDQKKVLEIYYH